MNETQKNWILNTFFKNEKFAGWKNIAEKLIDTGSCITTSQATDIWIGGIGNFIKSGTYEEGVGIIELTFDLKTFVSRDNAFFMQYYNQELILSKKKLEEAEERFNSIRTLT